jgi:hypothetical protein
MPSSTGAVDGVKILPARWVGYQICQLQTWDIGGFRLDLQLHRSQSFLPSFSGDAIRSILI